MQIFELLVSSGDLCIREKCVSIYADDSSLDVSVLKSG